MKLNQLIVMVARHTGWTLEYIGQLPVNRLLTIAAIIDHQRKLELYKIEYRLGQIMCTLANSKKRKYNPEQFVGNKPKPLEVKEAMTTKANKRMVKMGDGKEYNLATLNANMMEAIEEEFNESWDKLMTSPRAKVAKALVHAMLRPNYPELTREQVGDLLDTPTLFAVQKIIIGQR